MKAAFSEPSLVTPGEASASPRAAVVMSPCSIEALFSEHADFVFRSCRRLGLDSASAEDATQQVFLIAAKRLDQIAAGKERAFLFVTASNIVANARRAISRRREQFTEIEQEDLRDGPEELLDQARARLLMDRVLDRMDFDLRTVFVLFEVEQLTFTEISELLGIPRGTVASRVRRARAEFDARVCRLESVSTSHGAGQ